MNADVTNEKAVKGATALLMAALLISAAGCKAGRNGISAMGPEPKDSRVEAAQLSGALTVPTFLSLIGNKNSAEAKSLPPSVQVLLASQAIVDARSKTSPAVAEPVVADVEPAKLWDGKARGGVAEGTTVAPGWIWEPPTAPLVPPLETAPNKAANGGVAPSAEKSPVERSVAESAPVEKPPVKKAPFEDLAPIERVDNAPAPSTLSASQPEARAQLASSPAPSEQSLKRDDVLLIAFLVVLAVIGATFYALLKYRAEQAASAHEWRRLR